jgi:hypothetical protein
MSLPPTTCSSFCIFSVPPALDAKVTEMTSRSTFGGLFHPPTTSEIPLQGVSPEVS